MTTFCTTEDRYVGLTKINTQIKETSQRKRACLSNVRPKRADNISGKNKNRFCHYVHS
jgi:hypothetical protein